MSTPLISIVTPVGPRHHEHVKVARASLLWQTVPRDWWEHIVIEDADRAGPAKVRNQALAAAQGTFTVFLDADDYLIPTALETYLRGYATTPAAYVYADNYVITREGWHYSNSAEYDQARQAKYNAHVVTAMVPTALARDVGGFDEAIDIWEDWAFWLRMAIKGYCGQRLAQPALVYRLTEGERMSRGVLAGESLMTPVWRQYANEQGQIVMCGCNKPKSAVEAQQAAALAVQVLGGTPAGPDGLTRLEYQGPQRGSFLVTAPNSRQQYRLGGRRIVDAVAEDVEYLINLGCAPVVRAEFAPPPPPVDEAALSDAPAQPEAQPLNWGDSDNPLTEAEAKALPGGNAGETPELAPGPEAPVEGVPFEPKRMKRRAS